MSLLQGTQEKGNRGVPVIEQVQIGTPTPLPHHRSTSSSTHHTLTPLDTHPHQHTHLLLSEDVRSRSPSHRSRSTRRQQPPLPDVPAQPADARQSVLYGVRCCGRSPSLRNLDCIRVLA